ncbi:MAG: DUF2800 domain-containing protein [Paludibacteraceae bacterium]|nr:DUF2800 domain-containing protein [Paludibacteraceae bacterium]
MAQHAILSASGSHRWLHCTPSALLEKDVPDSGSDYAREGSLAHAYCAKALKESLGIGTKGEDIEIEELQDYFTDEMPGHVETYTDIVLGKFEEAKKSTPDAVLMVEQRLDFSKYIPEGFGTGDAIIVADGTLEICDFKYGKGVEVSAIANSQMMIYALGAYERFSDEYRIERVRMTIIQPRIGNLSEYELEIDQLLYWADNVLTPTAKKAIKGEGEQVAGDWCQFCKVKCQCKALAKRCTEDFDALQESGTTAELMTNDDIARLLPKLSDIKKWAEAVGEYALDRALKGDKFPGYKLVEGRSIRKIIDEEAAASKLTAEGFDADNLYKPRALKGITDLEGIVGKKNLATLLDGILVKPQGKPALVPESDKRPPLNSNSAESDFESINN